MVTLYAMSIPIDRSPTAFSADGTANEVLCPPPAVFPSSRKCLETACLPTSCRRCELLYIIRGAIESDAA